MQRVGNHINDGLRSRLTCFCVNAARKNTLQPWYTPYKFSGKEKDEETAYSYFGARYYDSDLSVWLSVDPMADKYPSMSAYMYCAGNPVVLKDPNGMEIIGSDGKPISYIYKNGKIEWSPNATADHILIGSAMLATPQGTEALNSMISIPTKISLMTGKLEKGTTGITIPGSDPNNRTGIGYLESATIVIDVAQIEELTNNGFYINSEEGINSVSTHERWHLDPTQLDWESICEMAGLNYNYDYEFFEKFTMAATYQTRSAYRERYQNGVSNSRFLNERVKNVLSGSVNDGWDTYYRGFNPNNVDFSSIIPKNISDLILAQ